MLKLNDMKENSDLFDNINNWKRIKKNEMIKIENGDYIGILM